MSGDGAGQRDVSLDMQCESGNHFNPHGAECKSRFRLASISFLLKIGEHFLIEQAPIAHHDVPLPFIVY
jgi:hypothetical protein